MEAVKVLISGSCGFLGRHFAARLLDDGHEVVEVDVMDAEDPTDALDFFHHSGLSVDLAIHCAAVSPHRSAIDGQALAVGARNLELDAALFDWAANRGQPGRVVYFSSSAAYPLQGQMARNHWALDEAYIDLEYSQGDPDAIYGWVKLTGERLAAAYRQQGGAVTVLRPFSGYGEDQSGDFPFGAFRDRALRRENPFTVWGDGSQVRDWIHVDDVVGATLAAVERGVDGPLNLCTGRGVSMAELATLFMVASGYCPDFDFQPDKPAGVAYRVGDPTRMRELYEPTVSLEEGVRRALAVEAVPR